MKRDAKQVLTELLVLKAQGGEDAAFRELYELWSRDLSRLASLQLSGASVVEEVVQDAWVAIAKGLGRLEDPARFPSWAFRILDRRCVDWIRKVQRERTRAGALDRDDLYPENGDALRSSDSAANLSEAIALLDSEGRKLLHFFYEVGLSVAEIGEVLDIPEGTVKSRLFALREKLKRELEGQ